MRPHVSVFKSVSVYLCVCICFRECVVVLGVDSEGACGEAVLLSDVLCVCVRESPGTFFASACTFAFTASHLLSKKSYHPLYWWQVLKEYPTETHTPHTHTHCSHTDTHTCAAHSRVFQSAVKTAQLSVGGTSSTLQPAALCICPPPPFLLCAHPNFPSACRFCPLASVRSGYGCVWRSPRSLCGMAKAVWRGGGGRAGCQHRGQAPRQAPPTHPR